MLADGFRTQWLIIIFDIRRTNDWLMDLIWWQANSSSFQICLQDLVSYCLSYWMWRRLLGRLCHVSYYMTHKPQKAIYYFTAVRTTCHVRKVLLRIQSSVLLCSDKNNSNITTAVRRKSPEALAWLKVAPQKNSCQVTIFDDWLRSSSQWPLHCTTTAAYWKQPGAVAVRTETF